MFEEWIAQGNSMTKRLRLELDLPAATTKSIPDAQRVPVAEMEKWLNRVRNRIEEEFTKDTVLRFEDLKSISSKDIKRDDAPPAEQAIIRIERMIAFMEELEARALSINHHPERNR